MTISEHIQKQIERFKQPYTLEDGIKIDRIKDIEKIYYYRRDKFTECSDETAIFWNIAITKVPHFLKNLLPSIKDFYPEGRGEYNFYQAWLTKICFRKWARESGFVQDLHDLCNYLTEFGEAVIKITGKDEKKDIKICDLRRIYFDRTVPFEFSDKIEIHELTKIQIYQKKGVWKGVNNDVFDRLEKVEGGMDKYKIYEFVGWHNEDETKEPVKKQVFVGGMGDRQIIFGEFKLDDKEQKYYRFELNDTLAGVYQRLFVLQELANRRVNQNDEAQKIASLLILRSANPGTAGNVLRDAVSGQIVNDPTLEQVSIDNRAISAFQAEMAMIENQASEICMTPEIITGGDMPSGTPFRSLATLSNKAMKAFKPIRTKIAEQISTILITEIFPAVTKNWENRIIEIADDDNDIREYDKRMTEYHVNQMISQQFQETGTFPLMAEIDAMKTTIQDMNERNGRKLKIDKGFFNWDFGFIYNHSNEVEDRAQQNDVMTNLLEYKMANPAIANDPLYKQLAEKNGVDAVKISQEEIQTMQQTAQGMAGAPQPIGGQKDALMAQIDTN
jgi:hypothetical protein